MFRGPLWTLATECTGRLSVRVEPVLVSSGDKVSIVNTGQVDLPAAPTQQNPERDRVAAFAYLVDLPGPADRDGRG